MKQQESVDRHHPKETKLLDGKFVTKLNEPKKLNKTELRNLDDLLSNRLQPLDIVIDFPFKFQLLAHEFLQRLKTTNLTKSSRFYHPIIFLKKFCT